MSTSTQCLDCEHYIAFSTCDAFPDKIPQEIFDGSFDHSKPYPGDGGITFDVLDGELTPVQIEQVVAKLSNDDIGIDIKKLSQDQIIDLYGNLLEKGIIESETVELIYKEI